MMNLLVRALAEEEEPSSSSGGRTPRPAQPLPRAHYPVDDPEEKARLIAQVLELQNTLEG